jgi:cob(I)alamin adenosyltransferase
LGDFTLTDRVPNPSDDPQKPRRGFISVFTGDGKGKTTAAIGTAVRAAGYGLRVYIVFFMKGKMFSQGEVKALAHFPNIELESFGQQHWLNKGDQNEEAIQQATRALELSRNIVVRGEHDLVILDEVNCAIDFGLISVDSVIEVMDEKPEWVDLILTGRHAHTRVVQMADIVTEMKSIKHTFEKGIFAREGIDY